MPKLSVCTVAAALILLPGMALADTYVNGYTRRDGTYVQPHWRSSPNGTTLDNWSTRGNMNPYTGRMGTRDPYSSYGGSMYGGSGRSFGGGLYRDDSYGLGGSRRRY